MNRIYLYGLIFSICLMACNKESDVTTNQPQEVELAINTDIVEQGTSTNDMTKDANQLYDRNGAPAHISGIIIDVEHDIYGHNIEEFPYETNESDVHNPITMSIRTGSNILSVETTTNVSPFFSSHLHYFDPKTNFVDPVNETLNQRAAKYSDELITNFPLYAEFSGTTGTTDIQFGTTSVNLSMSANNGRINVVFENNENESANLEFKIDIALYDASDNIATTDHDNDDSTAPVNVETSGIHNTGTSSSAWVFNVSEMEINTYLKISISRRAKTSQSDLDWQLVDQSTTLTQLGKNTTVLIYFNGITTVETGMSITGITTFSDVEENKEITSG